MAKLNSAPIAPVAETSPIGISSQRAFWIAVFQVVALAALTGLSAHAKFYMPFTPVPISLQTMTVVIAGALLGARKGAASQLLMIAAGAIGLPVFSQAGALLGPTAGYLIGFVLAAAVAGWMSDQGMLRVRGRFAATRVYALLFVASLFVFIPGVLWLKAWTGNSLVTAISLGFTPFMIGDVVKTAAATVFVVGLGRITRKPSAARS